MSKTNAYPSRYETLEPEWWPRFAAKFEVTRHGCWQWVAAKVPQGYGKINIYGKLQYSHRVSFAHFKGGIPAGLEIDHLCRNRGCCNPDHLDAVTHAVNKVRQQQSRIARERTLPHG